MIFNFRIGRYNVGGKPHFRGHMGISQSEHGLWRAQPCAEDKANMLNISS